MFKIKKTVMGFKGIFITHLYFYENTVSLAPCIEQTLFSFCDLKYYPHHTLVSIVCPDSLLVLQLTKSLIFNTNKCSGSQNYSHFQEAGKGFRRSSSESSEIS